MLLRELMNRLGGVKGYRWQRQKQSKAKEKAWF
jgi:hypothetical protein